MYDCNVLGSAKNSLTGQYLRREKIIEKPAHRRGIQDNTLKLKVQKAYEHNLKNLSVEIPLGRFVCLTGVSGSGKSTLMNDIIYRYVSGKINHIKRDIKVEEIKNIEYIDRIIKIDQSPIGRTPRSNPATYTKVFDEIREILQ